MLLVTYGRSVFLTKCVSYQYLRCFSIYIPSFLYNKQNTTGNADAAMTMTASVVSRPMASFDTRKNGIPHSTPEPNATICRLVSPSPGIVLRISEKSFVMLTYAKSPPP